MWRESEYSSECVSVREVHGSGSSKENQSAQICEIKIRLIMIWEKDTNHCLHSIERVRRGSIERDGQSVKK